MMPSARTAKRVACLLLSGVFVTGGTYLLLRNRTSLRTGVTAPVRTMGDAPGFQRTESPGSVASLPEDRKPEESALAIPALRSAPVRAWDDGERVAGVILELALCDPTVAVAYFDSLDSEPLRRTLRLPLAHALLPTRPQAALRLALESGETAEATSLAAVAAGAWGRKEPEAAWMYANSLPSGELRDGLAQEILSAWPAAASPALELALSSLDGDHQEQAVLAILARERESGRSTFRIRPEMLSRATDHSLLLLCASTDPYGIGFDIAHMEPGRQRDAYLATYAKLLARLPQVDRAVSAWVNLISDPSKRAQLHELLGKD